MPQKRIRKCSAKNCESDSFTLPNLSFFRFPKDENRRNIWVNNCGRADLRTKTPKQCCYNHLLCAFHFESDMFTSNQMNRLRKGAIPTEFSYRKMVDFEKDRMCDSPSQYLAPDSFESKENWVKNDPNPTGVLDLQAIEYAQTTSVKEELITGVLITFLFHLLYMVLMVMYPWMP